MLPARFYPPLSALRAAEAAARLGGFTAAAAELNITQSAVSQAVRQLEAQLGITLFERMAGGIRPTEQGLRYIETVRPAIGMIRTAGEALASSRKLLLLGCVRSLLHNWLLPRLPSFAAQQSGCELSVIGLGRDLGEAAGCDIAIVLAETGRQPDGAQQVARERLVPVCTPTVAAALGGKLEEMKSKPLLLGSGWTAWSRAAGVKAPLAPAGIRFRDMSASLEAARAGQGIALASELICRDDIAGGALVKASEISAERGRAYWLLAKPDVEDAADRFRAWLQPLVEGRN